MSLAILLLVTAAFTLIGLLGARWRHTPESYIGAHGTLGLWTTVATLFASGMGAWILFGPAETMVTSGIWALSGYALASGLSLWAFIILGPKLRSLMPKGHTLTEYVFLRYGRGYSALILLVSLAYMALAMTAELSGIARAGELVFGLTSLTVALIIGIGVMLYTTLGGFAASVATDKAQTWAILPLLALLTVGVLTLADVSATTHAAASLSPTLFSFHRPGLELAIALLIGIVGAELFNQGWWQRVWAPKSAGTMKKAYLIAGFLVVPVVFAAGLFGALAVGTGTASEPSAALFSYLATLPPWVTLTGMILAIALVMSSFDTLLNAMVALFTVDLARLGMGGPRLLGLARGISILLGFGAVLVATKGYSVLYLFLLADLLTLSAAVPVFAGLYHPRYGTRLALLSTALALVGGLLLFPNPSWSGSLLGLPTNNLMWSFLLAAAIPLALLPFAKGKAYRLKKLKASMKL